MQTTKRLALPAALLMLFGAATVFAQSGGTVAGTGSQELDGVVSGLDSAGSSDSQALLSKLAADYGVPLATLDGLLSQGYKTGEIWLSLQLAKASGKSLDQVVSLAAGKEGHGWGLVAQALGVKPGSKDFLEMVQAGKKEDAEIGDGKTDTPEGQTVETEGKSGPEQERESHGSEGKPGQGSGEKD